mmetsp:Transcript_17908/g.69394  ORF Transcript_17908/g.69394 Transcript_17908/m.69394 type:complete len:275 (-) Transcript_17908:1159-1983(-)
MSEVAALEQAQRNPLVKGELLQHLPVSQHLLQRLEETVCRRRLASPHVHQLAHRMLNRLLYALWAAVVAEQVHHRLPAKALAEVLHRVAEVRADPRLPLVRVLALALGEVVDGVDGLDRVLRLHSGEQETRDADDVRLLELVEQALEEYHRQLAGVGVDVVAALAPGVGGVVVDEGVEPVLQHARVHGVDHLGRQRVHVELQPAHARRRASLLQVLAHELEHHVLVHRTRRRQVLAAAVDDDEGGLLGGLGADLPADPWAGVVHGHRSPLVPLR